MKICPKCGGKEFLISAHVVQEWMVDGNGEFISCTEDCLDVTHKPSNDECWECAHCGYEDIGENFEIRNYIVTLTYTANRSFTIAAKTPEEAFEVAQEQFGDCDNLISYVVEHKDRVVIDGVC